MPHRGMPTSIRTCLTRECLQAFAGMPGSPPMHYIINKDEKVSYLIRERIPTTLIFVFDLMIVDCKEYIFVCTFHWQLSKWEATELLFYA